ncbi:hypothetical protein HII36_30430 [Nonomuraea sp. NN258]|uniref:hypothetical protein n=1 Tax=Nonomuraea antri TaxID=2730852 RepID=UPI0015683504|nr:hypothetical protein [Nonomuraea antri]NRQ36119.1 hypothetical protein [Nonomuraea antri]
MRVSLIAAGGALLAAAAIFGTAGAASADFSDPQNNVTDCALGTNDDSTYQRVLPNGAVMSGTRDADACKNGFSQRWGWHGWPGWHRDEIHHFPGRYNWPNSGNGNWVGHGFGNNPGIGV